MPFSSRLKRDYNAWVQRLWVTSIAALLYPTKLLLTGPRGSDNGTDLCFDATSYYEPDRPQTPN